MGLVELIEEQNFLSIPSKYNSFFYDTALGYMGLMTHPLAYFISNMLEIFGQSLKGDSHPIIVKPGFMADDSSTYPLRCFLENLGYNVYPWGAGINIPKDRFDYFFEHNQNLLDKVYEENDGKKISLIGWSLGGIYARELAKKNNDKVRQVITLGTPFNINEGNITLRKFFHKEMKIPRKDMDDIASKFATSPGVHNTSIYSKGDGISDYRTSIQTNCKLSENIEVPHIVSHFSLPHDYTVCYTIAKLLKIPEEELRK